ncbi:F-box protein At5g49610-like [Salvia hispanica]|uniref:F-box protein At5g49610-like n=1 Tax=Salvia hispanica TaxID=49212 RepID=UPI0020098B81|nr:F-box protein At5g49610-like [Salvia hispanica]XP_047967862.1 F-box protein At5g49610-like [Salvia hispanica]XP_047967863.1 F-box protein At5g49610-like [Salvia hispanica]XP_047967864.1 F-box protein At5g49610-like [Salvia hispanica]
MYLSLPPFHTRKEVMDLSDVIKENLLPFLPAKSLIKFMCVSKEWNQWIKSPLLAFQQSTHFTKLSGFFAQRKHHDPTFITLDSTSCGVPMPSLSFLPESVDLLASGSGLLLCRGREASEILYVCNPAIKEWTALPPPLLYHGAGAGTVLAFDPSARNIEQRYNLICAVPVLGCGNGSELSFELYNSRTHLWRVLDNTLVEMVEDLAVVGPGFYMKGVAYWLTNAGMVVAFDVERELHEVIPLETPPSLRVSEGVLTEMGGELCYIGLRHVWRDRYEIMIHGGMALSLQRGVEITIGEVGCCRFRILPGFDGKTVMIVGESWIYCYGISDGSLQGKIGVEYESASANKHLAYVNSLVELF